MRRLDRVATKISGELWLTARPPAAPRPRAIAVSTRRDGIERGPGDHARGRSGPTKPIAVSLADSHGLALPSSSALRPLTGQHALRSAVHRAGSSASNRRAPMRVVNASASAATPGVGFGQIERGAARTSRPHRAPPSPRDEWPTRVASSTAAFGLADGLRQGRACQVARVRDHAVGLRPRCGRNHARARARSSGRRLGAPTTCGRACTRRRRGRPTPSPPAPCDSVWRAYASAAVCSATHSSTRPSGNRMLPRMMVDARQLGRSPQARRPRFGFGEMRQGFVELVRQSHRLGQAEPGPAPFGRDRRPRPGPWRTLPAPAAARPRSSCSRPTRQASANRSAGVAASSRPRAASSTAASLR